MSNVTAETTFAEATSIRKLSSHTYEAILRDDWCIGSVPHGGFVTSCFLSVASTHFKTTLAAQNQPHTISLRLEFLRRTEIGPAYFIVKDAKIGRQTSIIQLSLCQGPENSREEVVGYITNSNMDTEKGITLSTGFELWPPPAPIDFSKLRQNKDPNWQLLTNPPFPKFRKASLKVMMHFPRGGQPFKSVGDEVLCFTNGERFTNESLGYVCDTFPMLIEAWRENNPYEITPQSGEKERAKITAAMWYPTLNLNLDMKKPLPKEGVEWLFVRVTTKQIKNGRFDLDVTVLDQDGDIVALSHHATLALGSSRNTSKRSHDTSKM